MAGIGSDVDIYTTPVVPPPTGTTSNFDRPMSSVQLATIIVFGCTYFLATVSLALRYVTSAFIIKAVELDVALITLSWLAALGYFISVAFMMQYGWGSHAWDISLADMVQYNNWLFPTTITYMWSPTLTKLSILTVLYRISPAKWYKMTTYTIAGALLTYTIVFTAILSGPCNPRDAGSSTCLMNLAYAQVALNICTDLSIMILPLPTLHKLQMPLRQKMVVGGILSLGSAVLIASVARAPYVKIMATNIDFSLKQAEAGVWSLVELNIGIVCNNLMRLKPFFNKYLPGFLSALSGSSGRQSKPQERSTSRTIGTWGRGNPGYSIQLDSLEHGDARTKSKETSVSEFGAGAPGPNDSTDSILR